MKDLIDVAGLPRRCGSSLRAEDPADQDADCVRLLREAGAIIIGKTVTTEFGYFKRGPTRNPANPALRGWWGIEFVSLKTRGPVALLG